MLANWDPLREQEINYAWIIEETVRKLSTLILEKKPKAEIEVFAKNIFQMERLKLNQIEEKIKVIIF